MAYDFDTRDREGFDGPYDRPEDDFPSSESDWDRADARQRGSEHPEQAWVLSDRDVWHRNPFYSGPPVPHPDEES